MDVLSIASKTHTDIQFKSSKGGGVHVNVKCPLNICHHSCTTTTIISIKEVKIRTKRSPVSLLWSNWWPVPRLKCAPTIGEVNCSMAGGGELMNWRSEQKG